MSGVKGSGAVGEKYAAKYLSDKGFSIVCKNFRTRYGEIDIIAANDEYLLFVEVKSRSGNFSSAREAVTVQKQKKLIMTALMYLEQNKCELQPRFDVIEVYFRSKTDLSPIKLCHIENAFDAEGTY